MVAKRNRTDRLTSLQCSHVSRLDRATAAIFANRFLVIIYETVSWTITFTIALDPSIRQPPAAPVPPPASPGPYDDNAACISDRQVNSCQPALQLTGRGFDIGAISCVWCHGISCMSSITSLRSTSRPSFPRKRSYLTMICAMRSSSGVHFQLVIRFGWWKRTSGPGSAAIVRIACVFEIALVAGTLQ